MAGVIGHGDTRWESIRAGTFYLREIAASLLNDVLGRNEDGLGDLVPLTFKATVEGEVGSIQLYDEVAQSPYLLSGKQKLDRVALEKARVFDFLIDNADRNGGNWLVRKRGGRLVPVLIDHGVCFPLAPVGALVHWRLDGMTHLMPSKAPLSEETKGFIARISPEAVANVLAKSGIERRAVEQVLMRLARLQKNPEMVAIGRRYMRQQIINPRIPLSSDEETRALSVVARAFQNPAMRGGIP
jgi:hypothetical protein